MLSETVLCGECWRKIVPKHVVHDVYVCPFCGNQIIVGNKEVK